MAGDQKEAAQKRTAAFLKADPDHFKKLAAKRKGKKNPSSTKFTKKTAAAAGSKGGKAKRRSKEEIDQERSEKQEQIDSDNAAADKEFQDGYDKKFKEEGIK